jgi:protein gp37
MPSKIEWTDETWNPVVGCSKISAGCENCYAQKMACRLAHMGNRAYQDVVRVSDQGIPLPGRWNGKTAFVETALYKPLHWKKPRRIFVCSMGDLFHESVPFKWVHQIWDIMKACPQHTFMILTKRPEKMKRDIELVYMKERMGWAKGFWQHVWLGVTAENQETADERIPVLLQIPAAVRFVSVEPMLWRVDLTPWLPRFLDFSYTTDPARLDWIICGGESGPGARPLHPDWARSLRDQCQDAEVPFFFKQWGNFCRPDQMPADTYQKIDAAHNLAGHGDYDKPWHVGKKAAGRLLDSQEWNEFPS